MNADIAAQLGREALYITLLIALPTMVIGMLTGLLISLFQSVTSIQEQTLSLVPKIIVTLVVVVITFPWIANHLVQYTLELFVTIPDRF